MRRPRRRSDLPQKYLPDYPGAGKILRPRGLMLLICGMDGNVLRFLFPLTIEQGLFDEALAILREALTGA